MNNLPDDIVYIIFNYSINSLNSLVSLISSMPDKIYILNKFKNKNIVNK